MTFRTLATSIAFLIFLSGFASAQTASCTRWRMFNRVDGREQTIGYGIANSGIVVGGTDSGYHATQPPAFIRNTDGTFEIYRYHELATTFARRNAQGVIVGYYAGAAGHSHGIVVYGSKAVTLNYPSASDTFPLGINKYGTIVGLYRLPGSYHEHGFEFKDGQFYTVQYPGAADTRVESINDNGVMVGSERIGNDVIKGFIRQKNGTFTTVTHPKATGSTDLHDINNAGTIVGDYVVGVNPQPFMYSDGMFKDINVPNVKSYSTVKGINDDNDITGEVFTNDAAPGFIGWNCK